MSTNQVKHTPGPWKATHIGEGEEYRKEIVVDVATCGQIADVLDTGNGQANARLIAAAPAMAEALETITKQCGPFAERQPALDYATIGNIARDALKDARLMD